LSVFLEMGYSANIEQNISLANGGVANIDVVVKDLNASLIKTYLIECKYWDKPIPREKVQSFKMDVYESGANIGIFVSKSGYQADAETASKYSNIVLLNYEQLQHSYGDEWYRKRIEHFQSQYEFLNSIYMDNMREDGREKYIFDTLMSTIELKNKAKILQNGLVEVLEVCIEQKPSSYDSVLDFSGVLKHFPTNDLACYMEKYISFHGARSYIEILQPLCIELKNMWDSLERAININLFNQNNSNFAEALKNISHKNNIINSVLSKLSE
jgi:Restriction endonuclease